MTAPADPVAALVAAEDERRIAAQAALVAALGELAEPVKGATATVKHREGGQHSYTYLTLPDLFAAVRPVFARHGLAVMQECVRPDEHRIRLTTFILHTSGHVWESPPLDMACGRNPQDVGSAMTYGRRYQLAAMVGLAGAEDDDAQHVTPTTGGRRGNQRPATPPPADDAPPPVDPETGEVLTGTPPADPPRPGGRVGEASRNLKPTDAQKKALYALTTSKHKLSREDALPVIAECAGWAPEAAGTLESVDALTRAEASRAIDRLKELPGPDGAP